MKRCLFALDIGGTFLKACLTDETGAPIPGSFDREPVDSDGPLPAIRSAYQALFRRMAEKAGSLKCRIAGVAADIPGPFDFKAGVSRMRHKYTSLYGVELMPWFTEILGEIPVRFLHDSSAFLMGAAARHPEIRNAAGAMIGTGLGFALMKDGAILQNENGGPLYSIYALPYRDKTAEEYVSGRAVLRRYNELSPTPSDSAKKVGDAAEAGVDPYAVRAYAEIGENLSCIIKPYLKELGIEALYLGGQISKSFQTFEKTLKDGLRDVETLRLIEAAEDLDLAHLCGVARWMIGVTPDLFSGKEA